MASATPCDGQVDPPRKPLLPRKAGGSIALICAGQRRSPHPSSSKYDGTAPVVGRPTSHEPHPNPTPPIQPLLTSSPLLDQSYPCPTPHLHPLHQAQGLRPPRAPAQLIASRASVSVCLGLYRPGPGTAFGLMARKRSAL